jgi:hypothetical protein
MRSAGEVHRGLGCCQTPFGGIAQRCGYAECEIGHAAWDDELADRVFAIKMTRHTKPPKFTGRVTRAG